MYIIPNYFLYNSYSDLEYYTILKFVNQIGVNRTIIDLKFILITTIEHLDVDQLYKIRFYEVINDKSECIPISN